MKRLEEKEIIKVNEEYLVEFSALPFKEVLDMLIEMKQEQAQAIKKERKGLLSSWRTNNK